MNSKYMSPLYAAAVFAAAAAVSLGSASAVKAASTYEIVIGNYTWPQALQRCRDMGGHLATIDSETEYYYLTGLLQSRDDWSGKVYFIGGKRDLNSRDYYWVDANGNPYGTSLLDAGNWACKYWWPTEPSYEYGGVQEYVCSIFKYQGKWILNDEPENMVAQAPDYNGIIGFICEHDDPTGDPNYVYNPSVENAENGPDTLEDYDAVFADAANRHNTCGAHEPYNGISYTVLDINGDGVKELIFDQFLDKHGHLFWIYRINNGSWEYMGDVEHDADVNNLRGYRNGIVFRECYKGSIQLYQALWNGSSFEKTQLMSGQFDRNGEPPTMDDLAAQGYYNASEVTDITPGFKDLADRSLLN